MTIFAGIAEFERDLIRERTGAGRLAAKKRGVVDKSSRYGLLGFRVSRRSRAPSLQSPPAKSGNWHPRASSWVPGELNKRPRATIRKRMSA